MPLKGLTPKAYSRLKDAFMQLPSIGEKSAWRMTQACLQSNQGDALAQALQEAAQLKVCNLCNAYTTEDVCQVCLDTKRDDKPMAVVLSMEERALLLNDYQHLGHVFILPKLLMPAAGIGLQETGIPALIKRIQQLNIKQVFIVIPESSAAKLSVQFLADMLKDTAELWQVPSIDEWQNKEQHIRINDL